MLYRLRDQDGSADPYSQLTWIDRVSQQTRFGPERWEWSARRSWESPDTKATYPIDFDLVTIDPKTKEKVCLRLRPLHDDQEIVGKLDSISYWEGACDVLDESGAIIGEAYVELTGYDGRLSERLR
jgi:predicted secreted hydrolase